MKLKTGQTLVSTVDATAVVVVRAPDEDVVVTCGGQEMVDKASAPAGSAAAGGAGEGGAQLGKRYTADGVAIELLCVKAGASPLAVNGTPVALKSAQPLPASD